tara:strand:+ start:158 stop:694 length:537 start_codon:yes stop_codon:yes gene_type:complete
MAVTEILGTDSLSSSRVTINDNFLDVQDEIVDLKALLDPQTNTLSGVDITASSITISGSPGTATLLNTTATSLEVSGETDLQAGIIKSGVQTGVTTLPATLAHSTYFVDLTNQIALVNGQDGQEITLIAESNAPGTVDEASVANAATSITMNSNGSTLTLRCFSNVWYVIGSHDTTIV